MRCPTCHAKGVSPVRSSCDEHDDDTMTVENEYECHRCSQRFVVRWRQKKEQGVVHAMRRLQKP